MTGIVLNKAQVEMLLYLAGGKGRPLKWMEDSDYIELKRRGYVELALKAGAQLTAKGRNAVLEIDAKSNGRRA